MSRQSTKTACTSRTGTGAARSPADYVVNAMGIIPVAPDEFRELVPETYVVGDCSDIGTIKKANHSGFDAAMEI